jgi:hypothetical protein
MSSRFDCISVGEVNDRGAVDSRLNGFPYLSEKKSKEEQD